MIRTPILKTMNDRTIFCFWSSDTIIELRNLEEGGAMDSPVKYLHAFRIHLENFNVDLTLLCDVDKP